MNTKFNTTVMNANNMHSECFQLFPVGLNIYLCRMKKTGLDNVSVLDCTKLDRLSTISSGN